MSDVKSNLPQVVHPDELDVFDGGELRLYVAAEQVQEGDYIAGMVVGTISDAKHNDQPAKRFSLTDTMDGNREYGRLVVMSGAVHPEHALEIMRVFESVEAKEQFIIGLKHPGYEKVEARQVKVGDWVNVDVNDDAPGIMEGMVKAWALVVREGNIMAELVLTGTEGRQFDGPHYLTPEKVVFRQQ